MEFTRERNLYFRPIASDLDAMISFMGDLNYRADLVSEIIFDCTPVDDIHHAYEVYYDPSELRQQIIKVFSEPSRSTNLRTLRLHSHPEFEENLDDNLDFGVASRTDYLNLQILVLHTLLVSSPLKHLSHLEITNLLALPPSFVGNLYNKDLWTPFLQPVRELSLFLLSHPHIRSLESSDALDFWIYSLPTILNAACSAETLKLSTNDIVSTAMIGWESITMPNLQYLKLGSMMLQRMPDYDGLPQFIERVKPSYLKLSECAIANSDFHPTMFWNDFLIDLRWSCPLMANCDIDVNYDRDDLVKGLGWPKDTVYMCYYKEHEGEFKLDEERNFGDSSDYDALQNLKLSLQERAENLANMSTPPSARL